MLGLIAEYAPLRLIRKSIYRIMDAVSQFQNQFRLMVLRSRGAKIGTRVRVGRAFRTTWPHQLVIGNDVRIGDNVTFVVDGIYDETGTILLGDKVEIRSSAYLFKKSSNVVDIQSGVFIGESVLMSVVRDFVIGENSLVAAHTTINDTNHSFDREIGNRKYEVYSCPIVIERNVWIGLSSTILQGVSIGESAVIGAGAVVNKTIPAFEVWGGVPCRFIKAIV